MSRGFWCLVALAVLGLAGCSHTPTVSDEQMAALNPTQLSSVRANEAGVAQAQQSLAQQQEALQQAKKEREVAQDEQDGVKSAIDTKQQEIDAKKSEKEQLEQQLEAAKAHVSAGDAQVEWTQARLEAAQAEVAHQQALLDQAKYQALVNAKDPSAQTLKAEDFAERVRQSEAKVRDTQGDATKAQQRYQEQRAAWQGQ